MKKAKKTEELERKQQHKAGLKRRRESPVLKLGRPTRQEKQRILIVCEGANTEPSYFRQFRLTSAEILALGAGSDTIRVIQRAREEQQNGNYDQVWAVFDKDDFPANNFNKAIAMAESWKINVAYSNQAFEYWLILHFEDHQGGGMHRDKYHAKLNGYLKVFNQYYDGNSSKKITKEIFDLLESKDHKTNTPRIQLAIRRAKHIYDQYTHENPAKEESSTTIFKLVVEILKYV